MEIAEIVETRLKFYELELMNHKKETFDRTRLNKESIVSIEAELMNHKNEMLEIARQNKEETFEVARRNRELIESFIANGEFPDDLSNAVLFPDQVDRKRSYTSIKSYGIVLFFLLLLPVLTFTFRIITALRFNDNAADSFYIFYKILFSLWIICIGLGLGHFFWNIKKMKLARIGIMISLFLFNISLLLNLFYFTNININTKYSYGVGCVFSSCYKPSNSTQ